jgi:hypothetical protein
VFFPTDTADLHNTSTSVFLFLREKIPAAVREQKEVDVAVIIEDIKY